MRTRRRNRLDSDIFLKAAHGLRGLNSGVQYSIEPMEHQGWRQIAIVALEHVDASNGTGRRVARYRNSLARLSDCVLVRRSRTA